MNAKYTSPINPSEIHVPVMLERTIELLAPALSKADAVMVDGTLGMGGHSEALLERFKNLTLIGIDRDEQALEIASVRLKRFADRTIFKHAIYDEFSVILDELKIDAVDGALLDLGVSSLQLDERERGFSYSQEAPLDMRMSSSEGLTAADLLKEWSEKELRTIFSKYGEEPLAARYAQAIVRERDDAPIEKSSQLVDILQRATPYAKKKDRHPAKRVFQALRIAVNDELGALEAALPQVIESLAVDGILLTLAYHSLEDRIVKNVFKNYSTSKTPIGVPIDIPEYAAKFKLLLRGSESADASEQLSNPRSKPARLRGIQRIGKDS
ncbi:MAG TPA: 16S rRNA (cytosine(1402)-N(4))-methyltransferase RsmH [Microbacteriaceae bacterium]|nr:16S rRNA (cytosine(1402)-N(4))-methyltransferase RsmH [Microbacteriaceae bacterium]